MTGPLMVLAVLVAQRADSSTFRISWNRCSPKKPENQSLPCLSVAAGLIGIAIAYMFYVAKPGWPIRSRNAFGGLYTLVYNKYFVDEAYNAAVVEPAGRRFAHGPVARRGCRLDRRHREWRRLALARRWRNPETAAIRQYSQLCGVGGVWIRLLC